MLSRAFLAEEPAYGDYRHGTVIAFNCALLLPESGKAIIIG